jgi:hypothetical protein|tara:strand:- start:383 stop:745 length:363 start_codon:yes stop_codon:yes gene_type:complete
MASSLQKIISLPFSNPIIFSVSRILQDLRRLSTRSRVERGKKDSFTDRTERDENKEARPSAVDRNRKGRGGKRLGFKFGTTRKNQRSHPLSFFPLSAPLSSSFSLLKEEIIERDDEESEE